jgi:hypothetical protein
MNYRREILISQMGKSNDSIPMNERQSITKALATLAAVLNLEFSL